MTIASPVVFTVFFNDFLNFKSFWGETKTSQPFKKNLEHWLMARGRASEISTFIRCINVGLAKDGALGTFCTFPNNCYKLQVGDPRCEKNLVAQNTGFCFRVGWVEVVDRCKVRVVDVWFPRHRRSWLELRRCSSKRANRTSKEPAKNQRTSSIISFASSLLHNRKDTCCHKIYNFFESFEATDCEKHGGESQSQCPVLRRVRL